MHILYYARSVRQAGKEGRESGVHLQGLPTISMVHENMCVFLITGAHHGHKVVALQLGYFSFSYQTETFRAGQGGPPEHVQKFS